MAAARKGAGPGKQAGAAGATATREGANAPPGTLLARDVEILEGVHSEWHPFISRPLLRQALSAIDAAGDSAHIAPPATDMFNALRDCRPGEVVAVIVAQDPYPTPGDAMGYCFSARKAQGFPKSLQPIVRCLLNSALIKALPRYGDLRPLAVQGVLLLNAALTTREGVVRAHVSHWKPFMDFFLDQLCTHTSARFLLWGNVARDLVAPFAEKHGREVLFWSHPSPLGDNQQPPAKKFVNCDHFLRLNKALRADRRPPIHWALDAPALVFTDGGCPKNGAADAEAGFGVLIVGGHLGQTTIRGLVQASAYSLVDPKVPEKGFTSTVPNRAAAGSGSSGVITPTNNRAELAAFCWALLALLRGRVLGGIELVSDSKICVNTLTTWLPARRRKGTAHQLANFDLLVVAEALLAALKAQADVVLLTHTHAAHDRPCPARNTANYAQESCYWLGNAKADALAGSAVTDGVRLEIKTSIPPLRHFAA